jgi:hypothetical protein
MRTTIVAGVLAVGGLLVAADLAHAGCGGGGGTRTYGRVSYSGGGCGSGCSMMNTGGMSMPGMAMPAMNMGAAQAPAAAAPAAAAGHYYTCPMHPSVASATPGSCPYCHMALSYR